MSLKYLLSVDYQAAVRHLLDQYPLPATDDIPDPDGYQWMFAFTHFREVLKEHVDTLMTGQPFNEDLELTNILFEDYIRLGYGMVCSASVSESPGTVVREGGVDFILPLVKIEIEF